MGLKTDKFEVGNHYLKKWFDCLECAEEFYNILMGKKYLLDAHHNKIIMNTYGWENE